MFGFSLKRAARNWRLFAATLVGVLIASTLFASSNVGANAILSEMMNETLEDVPVDMIYRFPTWYGLLANTSQLYNLRQIIESVPNVVRTENIVAHRNSSTMNSGEIYTFGIQANSSFYDRITILDGDTSLSANETYIVVDSASIENYPIGSNYTIQYEIVLEYPDPELLVNVSLQVVGHILIDEHTERSLIEPMGYGYNFYADLIWRYTSCFIVDHEQTMLPLLDSAEALNNSHRCTLEPKTYIYLDRAALINPYDIQGSLQSINQLGYQISNALPDEYGDPWSLRNYLADALNLFVGLSEVHRMTFLQVSMPVFFVAFYMGITLNDVTFSRRRREVGLLLTKGFTRSQITSMFIIESVLIGFVASGLALGLSFLVVPFFLGIGTYTLLNPGLLGFDTIFLTFSFGIVLAAFSTYFPAKRAAQIPTAEAVREYTLAGEPVGYRKLLTWTLLILGAYKLAVWILGINVMEIMTGMMFTNPVFAILLGIWSVVDTLLGFWAPLFFFYGFSMVLIKGSDRFYRYAEGAIRRLLGSLGGLAAHNIRRRPGRTAAIVFIGALLVGYSVQTVGTLATSQDFTVRSVFAEVGADIKVSTRHPENVTYLLPLIRGIDGVRGAASLHDFYVSTAMGQIQAYAINVSEWREVAYFEPEWFSGVPAPIALDALASDNHSIILEYLRAENMGLKIGEELSIFPSSSAVSLTILGLFGPKPEQMSILPFWSEWLAEQTYSFVSLELLIELWSNVTSTGNILISLESPQDNNAVIEALEAYTDIISIESSVDILDEYNTSILLNSRDNMTRMGVLFAFILASVGTVVVIYLTLRERRTTTALMSARGTTYGQTVVMLMAESLTMICLALLVGLFVGFIVLYGVVQGGAGTSIIPQLVVPRFMPAPYVISVLLQIGAIIGLLLLFTLIPILIEARNARYDVSVLR